VLLPGEVEEAAAERAEREGVRLPGPVAADLDRLATELDLPTRLRTPGTETSRRPSPGTSVSSARPAPC
jgi:hypothetical protein